MTLIQFIFLAPLPLSKRTGVSTRKLRVSDTRCVCSAIIINWIKVIYWIPEKSAAITWPHTLTYKVSAMVLRQGNKWLGGCHLLNSSNLAEKLWNSWILSTSVCSAGSFSAHTATYSTSESGARGSGNLWPARTGVERRTTRRKAFLRNCGTLKIWQTTFLSATIVKAMKERNDRWGRH